MSHLAPTPAWTDPGTFPVDEGVHRIPLPLPNDGLRAVNVYVLDTNEGPVLVDSGWALPAAEEELRAGLRRLGLALGDISRFLITHVHRDHYTQAVAIRQRYGARIELGQGEETTLRQLRRPDHRPMGTHLDRLRWLGAHDIADKLAAADGRRTGVSYWELPDRWLEEGPIQLPGGRVLEAVATPGHTAGHLVFHDLAAGLLFAGDHVLPTITPSIGFEAVASTNPLGDYLASLALIRARPDAMLLPAHGPLTASAHARVDELIAHHGRRLDEIERAVAAGAGSTREIAAGLRWTRHERRLDELNAYNQMLAIFETYAHLALLRAQGRVAAADGPEPPFAPGSAVPPNQFM